MENALVTTHLRSKRNDGIDFRLIGIVEGSIAFEESLLLESFVDEVVLCGIERSLHLHHSSLQKLVQEIVLLLLKMFFRRIVTHEYKYYDRERFTNER